MRRRGERRSRPLPILLGLAAALGAGINLGWAAESDQQPSRTIGDLVAHPAEVRPSEPTGATDTQAMQNYRRFLELQNTDPRLRAEAMRRLGDLSLESGQLERMEKELGSVDPLGAEAIRLYTVLLKAYPDYPRNDEVL